MEIGAEGRSGFLRILRLAGIPAGRKDVSVVQGGTDSQAKKKVVVGWEG
jgi:hypothetical protein